MSTYIMYEEMITLISFLFAFLQTCCKTTKSIYDPPPPVEVINVVGHVLVSWILLFICYLTNTVVSLPGLYLFMFVVQRKNLTNLTLNGKSALSFIVICRLNMIHRHSIC